MDTALWSGVPVRRLLEAAEPEGDRVILHGADGCYNELPLEALWLGLLAYRMNGRPLPSDTICEGERAGTSSENKVRIYMRKT
ncbi:hypothetical protein HALLA_01485 (plasmid) [Halostagnicola larsenii XH-48]|uniref:Oxidoreductase molybdopterin-binding domain-containing protein n=1 Tax=Halostagnicola larsenii XH-48 TaxID=797299 RepID=W0JTT6_9EURY|nr:molybdopterin-dependent oxidoreductase [Halostagnicola larsenii]AHG01999.1 hypothetical protein HALLA_01485 [Halostagnicola larsenii XH-48]